MKVAYQTEGKWKQSRNWGVQRNEEQWKYYMVKQKIFFLYLISIEDS